MAQRSIRSVVLILRFCVASPLGSQTRNVPAANTGSRVPRCLGCETWVASPTVCGLQSYAALGQLVTDYPRRARVILSPRDEVSRRGGVCSGVIFKNLLLTVRGGAWNGRCDIGSLTPEAPLALGSSSSSSFRISPVPRCLAVDSAVSLFKGRPTSFHTLGRLLTFSFPPPKENRSMGPPAPNSCARAYTQTP